MIPEFTSAGLLPPGVYAVGWPEFEERFLIFNKSDQRLRVGEQLRLLFEEARRSGIVKKFLVAGSFVTAKAEPNDFDCLLVIDNAIIESPLPPYQYNLVSRKSVRKLFKGDIVPVLEGSDEMSEYFEFFQTTRSDEQVGIVEIEL